MSRLLARQTRRETLGTPLGVLEDSLVGEGIGVPGSLAPHPGVGLVLEEGTGEYMNAVRFAYKINQIFGTTYSAKDF